MAAVGANARLKPALGGAAVGQMRRPCRLQNQRHGRVKINSKQKTCMLQLQCGIVVGATGWPVAVPNPVGGEGRALPGLGQMSRQCQMRC